MDSVQEWGQGIWVSWVVHFINEKYKVDQSGGARAARLGCARAAQAFRLGIREMKSPASGETGQLIWSKLNVVKVDL
jgi:hypothetical protein